jgi:hypothetical protein
MGFALPPEILRHEIEHVGQFFHAYFSPDCTKDIPEPSEALLSALPKCVAFPFAGVSHPLFLMTDANYRRKIMLPLARMFNVGPTLHT